MPAAIVPHFAPVHPYDGAIIDRAKMQQQIHPVPVTRHFKFPRIPKHLMYAFVVNAGKLRLRRKWHNDSLLELSSVGPALPQALVAVIKSELPFAVQIQPPPPNKLRARIIPM